MINTYKQSVHKTKYTGKRGSPVDPQSGRRLRDYLSKQIQWRQLAFYFFSLTQLLLE